MLKSLDRVECAEWALRDEQDAGRGRHILRDQHRYELLVRSQLTLTVLTRSSRPAVMGAKLRKPPPTMTPALAGQQCQEPESCITHQSRDFNCGVRSSTTCPGRRLTDQHAELWLTTVPD